MEQIFYRKADLKDIEELVGLRKQQLRDEGAEASDMGAFLYQDFGFERKSHFFQYQFTE